MKIAGISRLNFKSTNISYYDKNNSNGEIECYTTFFRDDLRWEHLGELLKKRFQDVQKVQVFDIGCSDGSEVFSIVMLLDKYFKQEAQKFYPIQAYDLNSSLIDKAKKGKIKLSEDDILNIQYNHKIDYFEYFSLGQKLSSCKSAKDELMQKIDFRTSDVLDVLRNMEDDSQNTVLFFRNALPYSKQEKREEFYKLLGQKLGKNSIVVMGEFDDCALGNEHFWKLKSLGFKESDFIRHVFIKEQEKDLPDYFDENQIYRILNLSEKGH